VNIPLVDVPAAVPAVLAAVQPYDEYNELFGRPFDQHDLEPVPHVDPFLVANNELAVFSNLPLLKARADDTWNCPLQWWNIHHPSIPLLAQLARRYLCVPATSASSERVFSSAGLTIAYARAGLLPQHASELVLLKAAVEGNANFGDIL
jgi:hypothetical protein